MRGLTAKSKGTTYKIMSEKIRAPYIRQSFLSKIMGQWVFAFLDRIRSTLYDINKIRSSHTR